jgi:hypothetical protein
MAPTPTSVARLRGLCHDNARSPRACALGDDLPGRLRGPLEDASDPREMRVEGDFVQPQEFLELLHPARSCVVRFLIGFPFAYTCAAETSAEAERTEP